MPSHRIKRSDFVPGGVLDMRDMIDVCPMVLALSRCMSPVASLDPSIVGLATWTCLLAYGARLERARITLLSNGEYFYERFWR